jgi:azurin
MDRILIHLLVPLLITKLLLKPMKSIASALLITLAVALPSAHSAEAEKTIIIVANDTMKFDVTQIQATAGQPIHVQLHNNGSVPKASMGHNWVLLDDESIVMQYAMAAMSSPDTDYKPKSLASHVLAATPLLGPKEVGDVTFNAPTKPGKYPFICSFPGHAMTGMRGDLIVK